MASEEEEEEEEIPKPGDPRREEFFFAAEEATSIDCFACPEFIRITFLQAELFLEGEGTI